MSYGAANPTREYFGKSSRFVSQFERLNRSSRYAKRMVVLLAVLFLSILAWSAIATFSEQIIASGTIDANLSGSKFHSAPQQLSASTTGLTDEILLSEGESFEKGQLLLRLDQENIKLEIKKLETQVDQIRDESASNERQRELLRVQKEKRIQTNFCLELELSTEIDRLESEKRLLANSAQAELDRATSNRLRVQKLVNKKAEADSKLDQARAEEKIARASLEQTDLPVETRHIDTVRVRREEIEANYEVDLEELKDQHRKLAASLKNAEIELCEKTILFRQTEIRAPYDGIVTRIDISKGEWIEPGKIPVEIAPDQDLMFVAFVDSRNIKKVQRGLLAEVYPKSIDALRDEPVQGKVVRIAENSVIEPDEHGIGQRVYRVDIELDHSDLKLATQERLIRLGLNGHCTIMTGQSCSRLQWLIRSLCRRFGEP